MRSTLRAVTGKRAASPFSGPYLEAADGDPSFRAELPVFVAEIKTSLERWQIAEYLEKARETEPFDASIYEDSEEAEMERQADIRRCAADLMLVEQAREWLLEENGE